MKKIELAGAFTILGVLLVSQLWSDAHDNMDMPANEAGAEGPVRSLWTSRLGRRIGLRYPVAHVVHPA